MRQKRISRLLFLAVLLCGLASPTWAGPKINITVKTILASQGPRYVDPDLSDLVQELETVFRYSSYRLLSRNSLSLGLEESRTATLPGNRVLKITPMGIKGNRVRLRLVIHKKKRQVFETVIQLLNHGSITVGGPRESGGYLLFNIFSSF